MFKSGVGIGEKYNRKGKKGLKLKRLIFYLTGTELQTVVKTVLVHIKFYLPDTFQTPLYTSLAWTMS